MGRIVPLSELGRTRKPKRSYQETVVSSNEIDRAFPAKYKGRCPLCWQDIRPGELIFFRSGPKPMHANCPAPTRRQRSKILKTRRSVSATG